MPARRRPAPKTHSTAFRTYRLPESLRTAIRQRRTEWKLTVQGFLAGAVDHELEYVVAHLERAGLRTIKDEPTRPARLPLTDDLLVALKEAAQATGVPASRLLQACLVRGVARNRRWSRKG